jgi:hypothetical protein
MRTKERRDVPFEVLGLYWALMDNSRHCGS